MSTARSKYQATAPADDPASSAAAPVSSAFASSPANPRRNFRDPNARPSGHSGGGTARTPHRVSRSRQKTKKASRRS